MTVKQIFVAILAVFSLSIFVACGGGGSSAVTSVTTGQPQEIGDAVQARRYAEDWVTDYVQENVRHTVSFPMFRQEARYLPPIEANPSRQVPLWAVSGVFRVTNVFNAELEHRYNVLMAVKESPSEILYTPVSVEIGGEVKYINERFVEGAVAKSQEIEQQQAAADDAEQQAQREAAYRATQERQRAENTRTWKDTTGSYSIEATFVKMAGGKVTLEKQDGSRIDIDLNKLSNDDQQWVRAKFRH